MCHSETLSSAWDGQVAGISRWSPWQVCLLGSIFILNDVQWVTSYVVIHGSFNSFAWFLHASPRKSGHREHLLS